MAQNAVLVLKDNSATNRNFNPTVKDGLSSSYQYEVGTKTALFPTVVVTMRKPSSNQATRRIGLRVNLPKEAQVGDYAYRTDTAFVDMTMVIPTGMDLASIADLRAFAAAALSNAVIVDVIDKGAFPY